MQQWYAHGAGVATQPEHHDAFLYGAGDEKIGSIVAPTADADTQRKRGRALKAKFLKNTAGLSGLIKAIKAAAREKGWIKGIDGRRVSIRSSHAALNSLLQNAGAVAMKLAANILYARLIEEGYVWGVDFAFVANVHDEVQLSVRHEIAEYIGKMSCESITAAGEQLGFKCQLDGEYGIGTSWKDTH